jgi:hypothetical protein
MVVFYQFPCLIFQSEPYFSDEKQEETDSEGWH